jgi:hypothetical protein
MVARMASLVGQPPLEDSAALLHIIDGLRERRTPAGQADPLDDIGRQFFLNFLQDHIGGKTGDEPAATALAGLGTGTANARLLPLAKPRAPPYESHRNYHHDSPHRRGRIDPQEEQRSVRLVSSDHILDLVSNDDVTGHGVSAKLKKGVKRPRQSHSSCSEEDVRSSRNGSSQSPDVRLVSWASSGGSGRGSSPLYGRRKLLSAGSGDPKGRSASSDSSSSATSSSSSSSRSSSSTSSSSSLSITSSSSESSSSENTETDSRTRWKVLIFYLLVYSVYYYTKVRYRRLGLNSVADPGSGAF